MVILRLTLYSIDSLENSEGHIDSFVLHADSQLRLNYTPKLGTANLCGDSQFDFMEDIELHFEHKSQKLLLEFSSNIEQNTPQRSYGFANLLVIPILCGNNCTYCNETTFVCIECKSNFILNSTNYSCQCGYDEYTSLNYSLCVATPDACDIGSFANPETHHCTACSIGQYATVDHLTCVPTPDLCQNGSYGN